MGVERCHFVLITLCCRRENQLSVAERQRFQLLLVVFSVFSPPFITVFILNVGNNYRSIFKSECQPDKQNNEMKVFSPSNPSPFGSHGPFCSFLRN